MRFLRLKPIYDGLFRLLDEYELPHFLVLVLYMQILLFDDLLALEQFLFDDRVGANFLVALNVQRLYALVLVVNLCFVLNLERTQIDNFSFNELKLFFCTPLGEL